ncbi:Cuticular protein 49Ah [Carabus blaptoides fortunei]
MRFLVISCFLVGAALALPQRRQYEQQPNEYPAEPQEPVRQQFQEQRPKSQHDATTFIPIIRFDKEQGSDGSYKTAWETGNNIIAEEEGFLKGLGPDPDNKGEEIHAQVQHGSYSYTAPDGQLITVHYTADEHGFRPTGDHLPTPPPVSPEVQKGLDLIYAGIKAQQEAAGHEGVVPVAQANGQYRQ